MQQDEYARKIAMELERYRADEAAGDGVARQIKPGVPLRGAAGRNIPVWRGRHPAPHCRGGPLHALPAGGVGEDRVPYRGRREEDHRA